MPCSISGVDCEYRDSFQLNRKEMSIILLRTLYYWAALPWWKLPYSDYWMVPFLAGCKIAPFRIHWHCANESCVAYHEALPAAIACRRNNHSISENVRLNALKMKYLDVQDADAGDVCAPWQNMLPMDWSTGWRRWNNFGLCTRELHKTLDTAFRIIHSLSNIGYL